MKRLPEGGRAVEVRNQTDPQVVLNPDLVYVTFEIVKIKRRKRGEREREKGRISMGVKRDMNFLCEFECALLFHASTVLERN